MPRGERLSRPRRPAATGDRRILQPPSGPKQSRGVLVRRCGERGRGNADHRRGARRHGLVTDRMSPSASRREPWRVAIVGAGPSGSALAILLARQGDEVTLFDAESRPELLVGESLVPAVVPILRKLGI